MGKGEIARNEEFLLFPTVFYTSLENFLQFLSNLKLSSAISCSLEESKNLSVGKGLREILCSNPLQNDKILDWSKCKAFADDKINVG